MRRSAAELDKMRKAGKVVAEMHEKTRAAILKAAQKLLDLGHGAGLIPHRVQLEFVR